MRVNRLFIIGLFGVFILLAYYFLINKDFLTSRYLSIPVLLMYPWIGVGSQKFFEYLSMKLSKNVFAAIFILFFILPVYQCIEQAWKQDKSLMVAAKWIAKNIKDNNIRIITTDNRFLFYAGREYRVGDATSGTNSGAFYNLYDKASSYNEIEQAAIQNNYNLVVFRISKKNAPPQFKYFKKIKEFKGRKNISYIFSSPDAAQRLENKN